MDSDLEYSSTAAGIDAYSPSVQITEHAKNKCSSPTKVKAECKDDDDDKDQEQDTTFPQQLMDVIEQETKEGFNIKGERVLEWLPSGEAFIIRDKNSLEKDILPKYFNVKCKFTSFVRKLYRWGYRQVEKDVARIMIFMHPHFRRSDKRRCLQMRSIVKKPQTAAHRGFNIGMFPGGLSANNAFQAFSMDPNLRFGMDPNFPRNTLAKHRQSSHLGPLSQIHPQDNNNDSQMFHNLDQPNDIMNFNGVRLEGPPSSTLFMPNQFPRVSMGITSTEMFEAGLRMQRMEQRHQQQEQPQTQLMDMINTSRETPSASLSSLVNPSSMASTMWNDNNKYVSNSPNSANNFEEMSKVEVVSRLMLQNPGIDPSRALELANRQSL